MQMSIYRDFVEGIARATNAAKELSKSREASIVITKLDEARLWFEEWRNNNDPDMCNAASK